MIRNRQTSKTLPYSAAMTRRSSGLPNMGGSGRAIMRGPALSTERSGRRSAMRYVLIDNKRYEWKEILRLRRQQIEAERHAQQPTLFELRDDRRPASQHTVRGR